MVCLAFRLLDEVTKTLQRPSTSLRATRVYFDTVFGDYSSFSHQPSSDGQTVRNQHFECELMKMYEFHSKNVTGLCKKPSWLRPNAKTGRQIAVKEKATIARAARQL